MTNETNTTETKGKRNRATREEMRAKLVARLAKIEAQIAGNFDASTVEGFSTKRLAAAIRRRETVLKAAQTLINGRAATAASPMLPPMAVKIANAEARLARHREDLARAEAVALALPGDIERLNGLLGQAKEGAEIPLPTDLFPLPDETKRSDAEIEAASVSL